MKIVLFLVKITKKRKRDRKCIHKPLSTEYLAAWGARGGKKRDFTTLYVKSLKSVKSAKTMKDH